MINELPEKCLPADVKRIYGINICEMSKWLDLSYCTLYARNVRKTYFRLQELRFILECIDDLKRSKVDISGS